MPLAVQGTFIHFKCQAALPTRRAVSCPPVLCAKPERAAEAAQQSVESDWEGDSDMSEDDDLEIAVGLADSFTGWARDNDEWVQVDKSAASELRLSDLMALQRQDGCFSVGSLRHHDGKCKVCAFAKKGECRSGLLCGRCHLDHEPFDRKAYRAAKRKQLRVAQKSACRALA